uniref:Acetoacetyl-CoA synthetase n=1 Tax=Amphimedon queenslandica TaxID=400682 RepID=A0A1X7VJ56_AMPQE
MEDAPLWTPAGDDTHLDFFRKRINEKYDLHLVDYAELWDWSVKNYANFWEEFFHFSGIKHSQPYDEVVDISKGIADVPEWFRGCHLNFAENLLNRTEQQKDKIAASLLHHTLPSMKLRERVARIANALIDIGVRIGDRVVGYLPNSSTAVEAMLATASIGAIWSSTSPDFGSTGVLDRFKQIKPKVIFSVEAVRYNGKKHDHLNKLKTVVDGLPDLEKVIIHPFCSSTVDISQVKNSILLEDFLSDNTDLTYEQLPFNHPLFIMYSSGTTGSPKCMVHSAGGTLIQHMKEHILHGNMTHNDVIFYYTTTGWMMWNWLVSSLSVGATVVLYDGSPFIPSPNVLWNNVDLLGITILGTGARWLAALEERNIVPKDTHKLTSLHTILSTGSPLGPASYDYVYNCIKRNVLLGSITGGTDIISCFAGQNPTLPVHRGEIQYRNIGMAVECWDKNGKPVYDESGELVCTKPFPSMPTHFWNDDDSIRYQKSYFSVYSGVWAHGDFCKISSRTGGIVMLGRSDGTLNPSGVRFGSAEIYNITEKFDEVKDSLCVGQLVGSDERVILFIKMNPGYTFNDEFVKKVKTFIRGELSARHVPALILETSDIPYTMNGKKVEVAVKKILSGQDVKERGALSNPESLDLYYNIPQLIIK